MLAHSIKTIDPMKLANARNHPLFRRFLWALVAFVLLLLVGWLAVPPILKSQAQKIGSEQLGRALTIGSVDFKPWSLELALGDIAIAGAAAGAPPQVEIKRLYIDASIQSLVRLAPVVRAVSVDEPKIRVTRLADGGYDFDDVLARLLAPSDKPPGKPPQFAVYNVEVKGGSLDFDDQPVGKLHTVRDLHLGLPFLSNFDSRLEVKVEPHLSLNFNGSKFETTAETTPFADSRKTDAKLQLADFDLAPYLGYLPKNLPLKLQAGKVQANVQVHFEQQPATSLKLTGQVEAQNFKANDIHDQDAVAFESVKVVLDEVRPLEKLVKVASIEVTAPQLDVVRNARGELNLLEGLTTPAAATPPPKPKKLENAPQKGASAAAATASMPASASKDANPAPGEASAEWRIELAKFSVKGGLVRWEDHNASLRSGAVKYAARDVALDVSAVTWPVAGPLAFSGEASIDGAPDRPTGTPSVKPVTPSTQRPANTPAPVAKGPITFEGNATDKMAKVNVKLNGLPLGLGAPYADVFLVPKVAGQISANLDVAWEAPMRLQVNAQQVQLDQVVVTDPAAAPKGARPSAVKGGELASVQTVLLTNASIGVDTHKVSIERLAVNTPRARVERAADQTWMFERWVRTTQGTFSQNAPAAAAVVAAVTEVAESGSGRWTVNVDNLQVDGGAVAFVDNGVAQPVQVDLSEIKAEAKSFVLGGKKPSPVTLSLKMRSGNTEPGRLSFKGAAGTEPLSVNGQVDMSHLPMQVADPYVRHLLNLQFVRADTSFKGQVDVTMARDGLAAKLGGNLTVEDFRANGATQVVTPAAPTAAANDSPQLAAAVATSTTRRGRELLSWKVLNLRGVDVALSPGKAPVASVKETALDDFYARIILNENGRLNLQDLVKSSEQAAATSPTPAASASSATPVKSGSVTTAKVPTPPSPPNPLDPVINFGPITLVNGRVAFSDFFIKPNYSADLSELAGKLSAFSSVPVQGVPQLADLELRGKAEGTASLDIKGKLNPLAKPLALDINAKVKDLELPPLSPYSIKYVGHGIERGKLSMDVHYNIKPDGLLTAENSIVLNQLTFGEPVPGAPTSLPVKLATALLSDSNGVIDLNLPISGSLNDPQFSIVPIIFKIIGNIIVKAVTAPFNALGKVFSGGSDRDELSTVAFVAGSDDLTPQAEEGLVKVAKALESKPALKLTVVGEASEAVELESYKKERLLRRMRAEKRRAGMADGTASSGRADATDIKISDAEYPDLVKALYKRADFPKPRNAIGLTKDLPVPEMEALLLANIRIPDDAMKELATQRGVAVRDYLAAQKLSTDRLFLGAPKVITADEKWTPRANLSLAVP